MPRFSRHQLFLPGLLLWLGATAVLAQTAVMEPRELELGEVATLTVELRTRIPSLPALDTTPLNRDFEVLSISPSVRKDKPLSPTPNLMRWKLELYPKRAGELVVPPLEIGDKSTPSSTIRVIDKHTNETHPDVFLTLEAEPVAVYVGEQVVISVKLYHRFPILGGNIPDAESDELRIVRSGQTWRDRETLRGVQYEVLAQTVAAFPEAAGKNRGSRRHLRRHHRLCRWRFSRKKNQESERTVNPQCQTHACSILRNNLVAVVGAIHRTTLER